MHVTEKKIHFSFSIQHCGEAEKQSGYKSKKRMKEHEIFKTAFSALRAGKNSLAYIEACSEQQYELQSRLNELRVHLNDTKLSNSKW